MVYVVPYAGNHLQKKMFMDFVNLGAFVTIFLALFSQVHMHVI